MPESRINNEALIMMASKEEPRLLNIILRSKESLMEAISYPLYPGKNGHFWDTRCNCLYEIIHLHYKKYGSLLTRPAIESVMDSMQEFRGKPVDEDAKVAIRNMWDRIYNMPADLEDFNMLVQRINERYVQFQAWNIFQNYAPVLSGSTENQIEKVKEIREKFLRLDNLEPDHYTVSMDLVGEGLDAVIQYAEDRRENPQNTSGIYCGIKALDDIFNGFEPGSYTIITGMINGGKTTLMMNMAFNMVKLGYSVVYVSLEKKARVVYSRLLCCDSMVDFNRLKRGGKGEDGVDDQTLNSLKQSAESLRQKQTRMQCVQMPQDTPLSKILAEVDKVKSVRPVDVLVVDYLGVIRNETNHTGHPYLDDTITSKRLMSYGKRNQMATITAQQLKNPSAKDIRGKASKATDDNLHTFEINTEDLAGAQGVPADADNVIGAILNNDHPPTKMIATITKARDDPANMKVVLDFNGALGKVSDPVLEQGHSDDLDMLIYNSEIKEDDLAADDGLFDNVSQSVASGVKNEDASPIAENTGQEDDDGFEGGGDDIFDEDSSNISNEPSYIKDQLDIDD